jgi:hypothetical protein
MARPSTRILRLTWAAVTADPNASARQIADRLGTGYHYGVVAAALRQLVAAGYIGERPAAGVARPIVIPFVVASMQTASCEVL